MPDRAQEWLALGRRHLAAGDAAQAAQALQQALAQAPTRLAAHNLIERHGLAGAFSEWMGCNCEIAPADDIYRFFENHPASVNPLRDYLADVWRTLSELMLLLEQVDRPLLKVGHCLEFASGHGRFTRHLVKALGAPRVTVSDAVGEVLCLGMGYDGVFVVSLFSHLPAATWRRGLRCL